MTYFVGLGGHTETWQIGKRVKKILDGHPELPASKQLDAFFLWGTALARLASLNDDPTLAAAAADKFDQMHELSQGDEAAFGPVGFSLWASSLLIVATETQDRTVLDMALTKFEVRLSSVLDLVKKPNVLVMCVCVCACGRKRSRWTAARRSRRGSSTPRRSRKAATSFDSWRTAKQHRPSTIRR